MRTQRRLDGLCPDDHSMTGGGIRHTNVDDRICRCLVASVDLVVLPFGLGGCCRHALISRCVIHRVSETVGSWCGARCNWTIVRGYWLCFTSPSVRRRERNAAALADVDNLLAAPQLDLRDRARIQVQGERVTAFVAIHPAPHPGELRAQLILAPSARADAGALLQLVHAWVSGDRTGPAPITVTLFELPGFVARDALVADGWEVVHSYTRMSAVLTSESPVTLPSRGGYPNGGVNCRPAGHSYSARRCTRRALEASVARLRQLPPGSAGS